MGTVCLNVSTVFGIFFYGTDVISIVLPKTNFASVSIPPQSNQSRFLNLILSFKLESLYHFNCL